MGGGRLSNYEIKYKTLGTISFTLPGRRRADRRTKLRSRGLFMGGWNS